ncbi:D-alanyl-D-alanine carboxypeptidase family protein [Microbacterium sp. cf332]|uniref:D-alanyl-D-alanine carboxypeptidase family protein n=1 Tax=Microbacterium sp. cf332 TaxID=1761804 RepID=UPI000891D572|nr:D-alanyl-D-alanine carboxypeptidase family protein [Microbacterium sp. cf332]SDQ22873.1 D-alanyl-D-alanine carboxypeptidase [Microbacterium sp. cf332]
MSSLRVSMPIPSPTADVTAHGRCTTFVPPRSRRSPQRCRRLAVVGIGVGVAAAAVGAAVALAGFPQPPIAPLPFGLAAPAFAPSGDDGLIEDGSPVSLWDDELPAIARLNPALLDAMRAAEADAAADGIRFGVTSGWRSVEYQQWLLDTRIATDGEDVARAFVATPDRSRHVSGDAIDIGPVDAQYWLISYGSAYGVCQTYGNEPWHFELATEPGSDCPPMRTDANG